MSDEIKIIGNASHPAEIEQAVKHLAELCKQYNCGGIIAVAPIDDDFNKPGIISIGGSGKAMDFCMLLMHEKFTSHNIRSQMMESN